MVRKCGYLPLAISLLGGVLSKKKSMREWVLVNANINVSIYGGEGRDTKDNQIEQVLQLSYEDLPYYLKSCFLYLAILREDENIAVRDLYMRWIAQGMISNENIQGKEETLLEIAELYLGELVSRCIVQVEDDSIPTLRYNTCKLHDVVRELCVSIGTKENFGVQILEYQGGNFSKLLNGALSCTTTRHLVIHFQRELQLEHDDLEIGCEKDTTKHLRSLEIRSHINGKTIEFPAHSMVDLQKFRMLKSLVIVGFRFAGRKLPGEITNLVHLKHLCLQECEFNELPLSISDLAYLDTLCLLDSWNILVPNVLKKIIQLKHLILPFYNEKTFGNYRVRLDVGDELETLMWFNSSMHELVSINRMKNLRRFSAVICDNERLSAIINVIAKEWTKLLYCTIAIEKGCQFTTSEEGVRKLKQVLAPNF